MAKVILAGHIEVPDADLLKVCSELPRHIELTREEKGCLVFSVEQDSEQKNRFNVYEEFDSEDAFAQHQERVKNARWGSVTRNVERHYQIKKI